MVLGAYARKQAQTYAYWGTVIADIDSDLNGRLDYDEVPRLVFGAAWPLISAVRSVYRPVLRCPFIPCIFVAFATCIGAHVWEEDVVHRSAALFRRDWAFPFSCRGQVHSAAPRLLEDTTDTLDTTLVYGE